MFFPTAKQVDSVQRGEQKESQHIRQLKSVQEQLEALAQKSEKVDYSKTELDKEIDREFEQLDAEVAEMIKQKKTELSFEVKDELTYYPEFDQVDGLINQAKNSYVLLRKVGKKQEAASVKQKIKEMKFHKHHLNLVMNLDFDRPTERMI